MAKIDALKDIVLKKKEKISLVKQALPEEELKNRLTTLTPTRPFTASISRPRQISLIAEIKKQSPSQGIICESYNPAEIAAVYKEAGVQAISVLTEEDFFGGSITHLIEVRAALDLPILRKDFILESYQIYESRVFGADAVLLIADLLTKEQLSEFIALADSLGMDCLVECHTEKELKKVLGLKVAPLQTIPQVDLKKVATKTKEKKFVAFALGINNRDLHTLEVDFKTTEQMFPLIPKNRIVVVESGIKSYQDVLFLKILGVSAVLVGGAILKAADRKSAIQELMGW